MNEITKPGQSGAGETPPAPQDAIKSPQVPPVGPIAHNLVISGKVEAVLDPELEQRKLEEREEACKKLPSGKDFIRLLQVISQVPEILWNHPDNYAELIQEILPRITKNNHGAFLTIIKEYEENKTRGMDEAQAIMTLAQAMQDQKVCSDTSIAEIGGSFTKEFLEKMGAHVDFADGQYSGRGEIIDAKGIVNWKNYKNFFPQTYDVVCTNNVFTSGSGLETAHRDYHGISPKELFALEYELVADGGAIVNALNKGYDPDFSIIHWATAKLNGAYKKKPKKIIFKVGTMNLRVGNQRQRTKFNPKDDF